MASDARAFPFSAIVASDDLATALILTTVAPEIGGVLVRGEKGTAKTTMVRALAHVLPEVAVVAGCRFSCDPADPDPGCPDAARHDGATTRAARLVELPVGASEDRVIGALDLQQALGSGTVTYQPGLLAAAHRGILYVDEVNLLHDHLVDLLLDAAATGRSTVEREGVSVSHASRIVLIGTMNPEEGELRPQLLDRFGSDRRGRRPPRPGAARRGDPPADGLRPRPGGLLRRVRGAEARSGGGSPTARATAARRPAGRRAAADHRRASAPRSRWTGCGPTSSPPGPPRPTPPGRAGTTVTTEDIRVAARLALPHRRRRNPFDAPGLDEDLLDQLLEEHQPEPPTGAALGGRAGRQRLRRRGQRRPIRRYAG